MLFSFYVFLVDFPALFFPYGKKEYIKFINNKWNRKKKMKHVVYLLYGEFFHFAGSISVILFASLFLSGTVMFFPFFLLVFSLLFLQEFYFHPKMFNQPRYKGALDFSTWVVPMLVYLKAF